MEIRGPNDTRRGDPARAADTRRVQRERTSESSASAADALESDLLESLAGERLGPALDLIRANEQERATAIEKRRDELLALAEDLEAIRRAARNFLASL